MVYSLTLIEVATVLREKQELRQLIKPEPFVLDYFSCRNVFIGRNSTPIRNES